MYHKETFTCTGTGNDWHVSFNIQCLWVMKRVVDRRHSNFGFQMPDEFFFHKAGRIPATGTEML
jgi:hypothetical protein